MKGLGYVGYGEVTSKAIPIQEFVPTGQHMNILDCSLSATNMDANLNDPEMCEWVVPITWLKNVGREEAFKFQGIFANQNIVCKLRDSPTVDFLRTSFQVEE